MIERPTAAILLTALLSGDLLAQSSPRAASCFAESFAARMRGAIGGYADVVGIPGVSMGIVVNDALVYASGVGSANKRARTPASGIFLRPPMSVKLPATKHRFYG